MTELSVYHPSYDKSRFYEKMGRFFAEKAYHSRLPYLANSSTTTWVIAEEKNTKILGFGSFEETDKGIEIGDVYTISEDHTLWKGMMEKILQLIEKKRPLLVYTAVPKEFIYYYNYLLEKNFTIQRETKNYYFLEKKNEVKIEMPISNVQFVEVEKICVNDYNPNHMAPSEMGLLELSIINDGYTQPIVCYEDKENDKYIIVDGFHRYVIGTKKLKLEKLPIVVIDKPLHQRIASTIRHNRARGVHSVDAIAEIVSNLSSEGYSDDWIAKNIGMEREEILRLKQTSGLKEAFLNHQFSQSWGEFEEKYYKRKSL